MTVRRPPRVNNWALKYASEQLLFSTRNGASLVGSSEILLHEKAFSRLRGRVQMIFTSPPFALNRKKKYGNFTGEEYKCWLASYAQILRPLLTEDGSIVIELGNAWEPRLPVMSTLAMESLLAFKEAGNLHLCQEFIWHNTAKLPTPAQWVNVERIRVKDAFTRLWWMSPSPRPKADNRRILRPYSRSMRELLATGRYNSGRRPSEHVIGTTSFLKNNGGAIPPNVLKLEHDVPESVLEGSNTRSDDPYQDHCRRLGIQPHPARMPPHLVEFFVAFCTDPRDIVLDPFAGSNTTGATCERLGRQWLSIEINQAYAEAGQARFSLSRSR